MRSRLAYFREATHSDFQGSRGASHCQAAADFQEQIAIPICLVFVLLALFCVCFFFMRTWMRPVAKGALSAVEQGMPLAQEKKIQASMA